MAVPKNITTSRRAEKDRIRTGNIIVETIETWCTSPPIDIIKKRMIKKKKNECTEKYHLCATLSAFEEQTFTNKFYLVLLHSYANRTYMQATHIITFLQNGPRIKAFRSEYTSSTILTSIRIHVCKHIGFSYKSCPPGVLQSYTGFKIATKKVFMHIESFSKLYATHLKNVRSVFYEAFCI